MIQRVRARSARGLSVGVLASIAGIVLSGASGAPAAAAGTPSAAAPNENGVELPAQRTAYSSTFQLPDGTKELRLSSQPVNFRDAAGTWRRIDGDLVRAPNGNLRNTANSVAVEIPSNAAGEVSVTHAGRSLSFSLVSGDVGSDAQADANVATFTDAIDGIDAEYEAIPAGVKETLTLPDRDARKRFVFDVDASGLTPEVQPSGEVWFEDALGVRRFAFAAAWMQDAGGVISRAARYSVEEVDGQDRIVLELDRAWLTDAARSYPVVVDPTVYTNPVGVCEITSGFAANLSRCGASLQNWVGREGTAVHRGLLAFDDLDDLVDPTSLVLSARLKAWMIGQSATEPADVDVHHLTRDFQQGVTWNRTDGRALWATPGGDFRGEREFRGTVAPDDVDWWVSWDVTRFAQSVVDLTEPSSNLMIKAADETRQHVDVFDSYHLEIRYTDRTGISNLYTYEEYPLNDGSRAYFNVANGNITLAADDLDFEGDDGRFTVGRYFNSFGLPERAQTFGAGGRGDFGTITLERDWVAGSYILHGASAVDGVFRKLPDGSFASPPGVNARLVENLDGTLTLLFEDTEETWFFDGADPFHRLVRSREEDGFQIDATYGPDGIASLVDSQGNSAAFAYDGNDDMRTVTDQDSNVHRYDYDGAHRLVSYTDPAGARSRYTFDTSGKLTRITTPNGSGLRIAYYAGTSLPETVTPMAAGGIDGPATEYGGSSHHTTVERPGNPDRTYFYDTHLRVDLTQQGELPALAVSGALPALNGRYDRGATTYVADASAAEVPEGIRQLVLDVDGAPVDTISGDCRTACPRRSAGQLVFDPTSLGEGAHSFGVRAIDGGYDVTSSETWTVTIDRTAPTAATGIEFAGFEGDTAPKATVAWDEIVDPVLAPGTPQETPGSGLAREEVRYQLTGGAWSAWAQADEWLVIPGGRPGDRALVEVRATDNAGNVSAVTQADVLFEEDGPDAVAEYREYEPEVGARFEWPDGYIANCEFGELTGTPFFRTAGISSSGIVVYGESVHRCRDRELRMNITKMSLRMCMQVRGGTDNEFHNQVCRTVSASIGNGSIYNRIDMMCRPGVREYRLRMWVAQQHGAPPTSVRIVYNRGRKGVNSSVTTLNCAEILAWQFQATHRPAYSPRYPDGWKMFEGADLVSPATALRANLGPNGFERLFNFPANSWHAHHVVPARGYTDRRGPYSEATQRAAYFCGIDPNGYDNGLYLRGPGIAGGELLDVYPDLIRNRAYHPEIHSEKYFSTLRRYLDRIYDAANFRCTGDVIEVRKLLGRVRSKLAVNRFPYRPGGTTYYEDD